MTPNANLATAPLTHPDGSAPRVLVVDDEPNIAELSISYLRRKIDAGRPPMIHTLRRAGYVLKPAS
jgi:hypothetical protein